MFTISRVIYPLRTALEDFLLDESIKQGLVSSDKVTKSKTIIADGSELSVSQYLSGRNDLKKVKKIAEARLLSFMSNFSCSKNQDVQNFLTTEMCISFEKRNRSRTYLILNENSEILGYFSLALKTLFAKKKSLTNAIRKKTNPGKDCSLISPETDYYNVYLIGQIGRNDSFTRKDLSLSDILSEIFSILIEVQNRVGGSSILIEVDNNQKLIELYKEHGFQYLETGQDNLSQLLILFDGI